MFGVINDFIDVGKSLLDDTDFTKQDLINLTASGYTLWEISQGSGIALELLEDIISTKELT